MLVLQRIEIENFGPFRGRQMIEFPSEGVTVIYGQTGRGKTSLLNAIRYAFYGTVKSRGARDLKHIHLLSNKETAAEEGRYGFSVKLAFTFDGEEYELTRTCEPLVTDPSSDADFKHTSSLRVGGRVTGPEEQRQLLERAMPEEVSRFFLFDGELLSEYEDLVSEEGDDGEAISAEIERILGVPILKNARAHLNSLAEEVVASNARHARKSDKTRQDGVLLQTQSDQREALRESNASLQREVVDMERRKAALDQLLREQQKQVSLVAERDEKEGALETSQKAEQEELLALRDLMKDAWRGRLADSVKDALAEAEVAAQAAISRIQLSMRAAAVDDAECSVCERALSDDEIVPLAATIPAGVTRDTSDVAAEITAAVGRVANLGAFGKSDNSAEVKRTWARIQAHQVDQAAAEDRIKEIDADLAVSQPEDLRRSQAERDRLIEQLAKHRESLREGREKIAGLDKTIAELNKKIAAAGDGSNTGAAERLQLLTHAAEVFDEAVGDYKDELRRAVERDASDFFVQLREEPDYVALQINEQFGLGIVHKDGDIELIRSAGQEHIVALALMGALQNNAPIGGPIVADSPFGRLDGDHKANIVRTLPKMAEQAALLVYREEIDQDTLREILGANLAAEYRLERVSGRHTKIVKVGA